jgi:protein-S-isoprenylcysteine O-methyltransferase Ste14
MTRARAAAGSLFFFLFAPCVVAGVGPFLWTDAWKSNDPASWLRVLGSVLIALGAGALVSAFVRFVMEGVGTPAPWEPTERLVLGGLYRYVRNPMYLAIAAVIAGQAALLGQVDLLIYLALFLGVVATFVQLYEQPALARRYGAAYDEYRRNVPAWRPHLRPWKP